VGIQKVGASQDPNPVTGIGIIAKMYVLFIESL
jgi:hypothetical protein